MLHFRIPCCYSCLPAMISHRISLRSHVFAKLSGPQVALLDAYQAHRSGSLTQLQAMQCVSNECSPCSPCRAPHHQWWRYSPRSSESLFLEMHMLGMSISFHTLAGRRREQNRDVEAPSVCRNSMEFRPRLWKSGKTGQT